MDNTALSKLTADQVAALNDELKATYCLLGPADQDFFASAFKPADLPTVLARKAEILLRNQAERERMVKLKAFFAQKAERFALQGIDNVFAAPGTADFIREVCIQGLAEGRPTVEIHALDCDREVLGVFACLNDHVCYSSMFNSFALGDAARFSPGVVLISYILKDCIERGIQAFDLGVGKAAYKDYFCDHHETLFDSYFGLSMRGQAYVAALSAKSGLKRWVKHSPSLMKLVAAARRLKGGKSESGKPELGGEAA